MVWYSLVLYHINKTVLFQTIQVGVYAQFKMSKTFLFQTIQFSQQLNGSKYCSVSLIIQLNIVSFNYTHLNVKTVLFQTIQFSISTPFKCQNISISNNSVSYKYIVQFFLTNRCYNSEPEWRWRWRGTPNSPNHQYYWSPTFRLFSIISRTLFGGAYPSTVPGRHPLHTKSYFCFSLLCGHPVEVIIFKLHLGVGRKIFNTLPKGISPKVNVTGVWTRLLRGPLPPIDDCTD